VDRRLKSIPSVSVTYAQHGASSSSNQYGMLALKERDGERQPARYQLSCKAYLRVIERLEKLFEMYAKMTSEVPV